MLPSGGPYVALPFIKEVRCPFVSVVCTHECTLMKGGEVPLCVRSLHA